MHFANREVISDDTPERQHPPPGGPGGGCSRLSKNAQRDYPSRVVDVGISGPAFRCFVRGPGGIQGVSEAQDNTGEPGPVPLRSIGVRQARRRLSALRTVASEACGWDGWRDFPRATEGTEGAHRSARRSFVLALGQVLGGGAGGPACAGCAPYRSAARVRGGGAPWCPVGWPGS